MTHNHEVEARRMFRALLRVNSADETGLDVNIVANDRSEFIPNESLPAGFA